MEKAYKDKLLKNMDESYSSKSVLNEENKISEEKLSK